MELKVEEIDVKIKEKKSVTFDDILSKMSVKLIDGKLQFYKDDGSNQNQQMDNTRRYQYQPNNQQQYQQHQYQQQQEIVPRIPLTKKQHDQLVYLNQLKRQNEIEKIRQIKSTKLLFNNNTVNIRATQVQHLNRFFK
jgi:outer membrane PBP1 activator LpoA protein